jgi:hypothetical protein|tara:strand:- start:59 stop:832 length:774 start_codon:yes stop_codon:yes gene_type:complete
MHKSASVGQMTPSNNQHNRSSTRVGDENNKKLSKEEGYFAFQLEEKERLWAKKMLKKKTEMKRLKALLEAADVECKNAEDQVKRERKRVTYAQDADLDTLMKSMQHQLDMEQNKSKEAIFLLEKERTHRSVGSVTMKATQTTGETPKHVECQTDWTDQNEGNDVEEEREQEDEAAVVKRKRKKKKKSQLSGSQWVKAVQYWDTKMPNANEGLVYFAKNYKLKDVQLHSNSRLMLLLRNIMDDKIGGDEHEQEITLQE